MFVRLSSDFDHKAINENSKVELRYDMLSSQSLHDLANLVGSWRIGYNATRIKLKKLEVNEILPPGSLVVFGPTNHLGIPLNYYFGLTQGPLTLINIRKQTDHVYSTGVIVINCLTSFKQIKYKSIFDISTVLAFRKKS